MFQTRNYILEIRRCRRITHSFFQCVWISYAFIYSNLYYLYFGTLLTAKGALKSIKIMAAFGVSINIILNLLFIPESGRRRCINQSYNSNNYCNFPSLSSFRLLKIKIKKSEIIALGSFIFLSATIFLWNPYLNFHWMVSMLITLTILLFFSIGNDKQKTFTTSLKIKHN